jgi:hypothetical protein
VAQGEERVAVQAPVRRRPWRPSDAFRRVVHLNPDLWRGAKALAAREHRTVSGLIAWLLERELGWDDED